MYKVKLTSTASKNLKKIDKRYQSAIAKAIDRLAKKNTWHKNKASNLKKKLTLHVSAMGSEAGANA